MDQYDVPLTEYWRLIRKRKWTIIYVFASIFLSTVLFTAFQTRVYLSSMELKVEKDQIGVIAENMDNEINIETEIQLLKSLNVMRKVVEKMEVLPTDPKHREQMVHAYSLEYQQKVSALPIGGTTIMAVKVTASSPDRAILLANALADVYIEENTGGRTKELKALLEHIDNQLQEYSKLLEQEDERLLQFQQDERVFQVTQEVKETLDRMSVEYTFDFEERMITIEEQIQEIKKLIQERKDRPLMTRFLNDDFDDNFIFMGLKRRLLELEFDRFLLLVDYTEKHPSVIDHDKIISEVKTKMVSLIKNYFPREFNTDDEQDLALIVKFLFLDSRREVLFRTVNRYYKEEESLSYNERDYLKLKRNAERLLKAYDNLQDNREEVMLSLASVSQEKVSIVSPPAASKNPIQPNHKVNYLIGSLLGLIMGVMMCFLMESMDTTVGTISDLEQKMDLPVLGIIPMMKTDDDLSAGEEDVGPSIEQMVLLNDAQSWIAESFKIFRTNMMQHIQQKQLKTILFTSSEKQEGKSTVLINTAISMAQLGKRTLIIGVNLRRPTIYKRFGLLRSPGMTDILLGKYSWQETLQTSTDILAGGLDVDKLLSAPGLDNLHVITSGQPVENISEILNSPSFSELLRDVQQHYDIVLVDSPPTLAVPDAMTICGLFDGVIMVYKVGSTSRDVLGMAKVRLQKANARIMGVVLNHLKAEEQMGASAFHFREYVEKQTKS